MNLYTISTGCYSDYTETKLSHKNKFTKEEFKEVCEKVCADLQGDRTDNYYLNEEMVVNEMISRYGFKKISFINCHIWDYSYDKDMTVTEE
jgi:hypothetical protein